MTQETSGGWLRSIFRRGAAEPPPPPKPEPDPLPDAPADVGPPPPPGSGEVSYFRLRGSAGRFLRLEAGANSLSAHATLDPAHAVVAIVPWEQPHFCLIASQDCRPFHIYNDTLTCPGISARILRSPKRGIVRLRQPLGGLRFLSLKDEYPDDPDDPPMRFDSLGNTVGAIFALLPIDAADVTVPLRAMGEEFGAAIAGGLRQTEMVAALRERRVRPDLAESILRLLPRDELDDLARRLLDDPALLTALRRMLPKDYYLNTALPALVAWRATRGPVSQSGQIASPATDETLLLACANETGVPPGLALHALARSHVSPRRNFCILAPARNEGPYLLEWLAYHLSIGFEHIFLYTNDNTDGSDALLDTLAAHGIITLVHNHRGQRIGVQEKANAHALTLLPQILDYRWTAVIDIDEYIAFDAGAYDQIGDFIALQEAQPVDAVALNWLIFVSKFGEPYTSGLTTQRFPWRTNDVNRHVKTIFRTRRFWGSQPHYPYPTLEAPFIFRTENGGPHHHPGVLDRIPAFSATPTAEHAWINHYIFRSAPEALWKLSRGDVAWKASEEALHRPGFQDFVTQAFTDFATSTRLIKDTRISLCAQGQPAMLEKLLSLPGVAEIQEGISANFETRLQSLAQTFLASPIPFDAKPSLLQFREALALSQGRPHIPLVLPAKSPVI